MSKPAQSLWIIRLLGAWITCSGALAGDCGSVNITSVSSADALRKNCQIVDGDVVIGPFSENSEIYNINLDGVEVIKGSLRSYDDYGLVSWPFAVSSTTLKEVQGSVGFPYLTSINLTSLSLPRLTTVGNTFDLVGSITSLNIKSLESVPTITLGTPYLRSIKHAKLTNVSSLWIEGNYLDSLDSFFNNPIDINSSVAFGPFPNIDTITVGFTSGDVSITSKSGVILGGPTTMAMALGYVYLAGGAMFLNRSSTLKSLTAKSFDLGGTSNTLLDIPFDDLTNLYINLDSEDDVLVEEIRLPPIAVNWTDFNLYIFEVPWLNLSSQYSINDNGFVFQTWYWPESVSSIYIRGAIVANPFFEQFLSYQQSAAVNSTMPLSNLSKLAIYPADGSNFSCNPFDKLQTIGRLVDKRANYTCTNATPTPAPETKNETTNSTASVKNSGIHSAQASSLSLLCGVMVGLYLLRCVTGEVL